MSTKHHVTKKGDKWQVKKGGASRASVITDTKAEAVEKGIEIAKNQKSELSIHNQNGRISEKRSYGNDPMPPKDKN